MLDVASLGFKVDSSALRTAKTDLDNVGEAAEKTDDKVRRASGGIERSFSSAAGRSATAWARFRESIGGTNGIAAAVSAAGVTVAVSKMVEVARATEEAQALFDQVFQDSATSVRQWSDVMAKQINRSAFDLQAQAAQFQQVLASMVPDRAQAAQMSTTLAGLAQDISAFYDIGEGEALAKLRSGLTGETEPLKALGIVLSATSVEAKALEMGLAGTAKEMTEADRVAARYALIMQLTADAQGAATREAASLSNQQKGLNGALNDAYRSLGQNLLPIVTQMTVALADLVRSFNSLSPETQKFIAYAAGLAAAIGPVLTGLGLMAMAIPPITAALALLVSPVGLVIAAFAALVAGGVVLYRNWDELSARFPVLQAGADAVRAAFDLWKQAASALVQFLTPLVSYVSDNLQSSFRMIAALLRGDVVGAFNVFRTQVEANLNAITTQALPWAADIVAAIANGLAGLPAVAVEAIGKFAAALAAGFASIAKSAVDWGRNIVQGVVDGITRVEDRIESAVGGLASRVKNRFTGEMEIQSPSRVFMGYGGYITEGLALGIEDGAASPLRAITDVADQLVTSVDRLSSDMGAAFGDWISSGLRNFKDFTSAILGSFKSMISDMIATAVRNPIRLAITGAMGGMGGAGAAAAGVPGAGGAGILGGIGAAVGGLASWGISGAVAGFTGLMSGGVGGALTAVGTQAALAGGGLSSLAVGLGAIAAPVAIVAGLFSFFKKSTKELDRGLRVTVEGMDALVETFTRTETRRFWGLSKKRKTDYDAADAATADPIEAYVAKMQTGVMETAKLLGVGAGAFENFSAQIKLSTKDMTDEQAIQAIQAELTKLGDKFAGLVPDLAKFSAEGEGALATLTRLSASLAGVNASLGDLGLRLYDLSVNGAGAAAAFAGLFGGLDQFQQAAGAYYKEFYSDAERMTRLQEVSTRALRDAGLAVPATREAYRALVEAQNLSTDAGRRAAAVLLQLAPAFDQMFDAAEAARLAAMQAIADANASRAGLLDSLMTDQQRAVQAQAEITATFAALNMTVPTTLEGLRAIIAGLDLTGEAGRTALARIAGIADALKDKLIPVQSGGGRQSIGGGSPGNNAAEERERLERQLLQLQGNTFELRQRELNALAPANRALQEMIWRLEDAKDAMDNLKTDGFATLVDFELARARQANNKAAPVALKAQETRQRQDSAILTEIRDYMFTVANNTHRAARETRDLRMLQEGTGA